MMAVKLKVQELTRSEICNSRNVHFVGPFRICKCFFLVCVFHKTECKEAVKTASLKQSCHCILQLPSFVLLLMAPHNDCFLN